MARRMGLDPNRGSMPPRSVTLGTVEWEECTQIQQAVADYQPGREYDGGAPYADKGGLT